MAEDKEIPCTFTGFRLSIDKDGNILQDQHQYIKKLEEIPLDATFSDLRSMRMCLAWLANTRPDRLFEISQVAQVTQQIFDSSKRDIIKGLNKAVKYAVNNRTSIKTPRLERNSLKIIGFSYASFANNADFSSQLRHICFLGDDTGAVAPISFKP